MNIVYFRSGTTAKQLGISSYQLRRLCEAGLIDAEITSGGQWRIPATEVDRLKREGIPPMPQTLPEDEENGSAHRAHHRQAAEPQDLHPQTSPEVTATSEAVTITENLLRKRKVEREAEETEDWFRERAQRQQAVLAEERQRAAEAAARRDRQHWENKWIIRGLESLPREAPPEIKLEVKGCVGEALATLRPDQPEYLTKNLVDAAVEKALAPWRRRQQIERIIQDAVAKLPYGARSGPKPTKWQLRALESAHGAVRQLSIDASLVEVEVAATNAVALIIREFEHFERCENVVDSVGRQLSGDARDREEASEAVTKALAAVARGTSKREMEEIRDRVLQPFKEQIAHRKDQGVRRQAIDWATRNVPWGMDEQLKQQALKAVQTEVGKLPAHTSFDELSKVGDAALEPFLRTHKRKENKKRTIDDALCTIYPYLQELSKEWEFETTIWALAEELKKPIRRRLEIELTGGESIEQVRKRVRSLVRKELNIRSDN